MSAVSNKRMTHLLVCETLKWRKVLDKTLDLAGVDVRKDLSDNRALVYILLFELLVGKQQKIRGGGALKRALLERESRLRRAMETVKTRFEDLIPEETTQEQSVPRFCRVNTLRTTVEAVLKSDIAQGRELSMDEHVPGLLRLPPGTDLHDHRLVASGELILQDKSSCFPVAALAVEMHRRGLCSFDAIDCCAAPGNKTTQLAAELTGDNARLYAFDKSPSRFELLKARVKQAGADKRVSVLNDDFLRTDPNDPQFSQVRTILLDPSCSGSGSYSVDRLYEERLKESDARVLKLAEFQVEALTHALSFPQAELVSYSTCSILHPENESVVKRVLTKFGDEWELVPALPEWKRRGESRPEGGLSPKEAKLVARADFSLGDETGGFFVALFARKFPTKVPEAVCGSKRFRRLVSAETIRRHRATISKLRKRRKLWSGDA